MLPNTAEISALPYRPNVGLMLLNGRGEVFAGQRLDYSGNAWQMPQGGIDNGETPHEAALRELTEETGLLPASVDVLRESTVWHTYDFPPSLITKLWNGSYRGQTQRWFALRYKGPDSDININTEEPEFACWSWMAHNDLIGKIVPFKRETYDKVFEEFADFLP